MARQTDPSTDHVGSGGAGSANSSTSKTRRSHRKSRNGCIECKRRHIRCDERQPSCANCVAAERTCIFPPPKGAKREQDRVQQPRTRQQHRLGATASPSRGSEVSSQGNANDTDSLDAGHAQMRPLALRQQNSSPDLDQAPDQPSHGLLLRREALSSITSLSSLNSNLHQVLSSAPSMELGGDCHPGFSSAPEAMPKMVYSAQHMILLHHAHTVPNFTAPNRNVVDIAICRAVDSPYLLDEVLAFTAFHLAYHYPGSAVHLRHIATELQNRALASFTRLTEMVPNDDKATAVPRFLFSGILGRHVLADSLAHFNADFNSFIDGFVECLNINRGIRAVTPPALGYLYNTEIQPFLSIVLEARGRITSPGSECSPLSRLMDNSDLCEASKAACHQAIELLQLCFDLCRGFDEDDYPQAASVFSVKIEAGFVDVLRKHRPEALVILAYYGVLLHRCRTFWAFSNAGAPMVHAIVGQLGSYWQEALAWPLRALETEPATAATRHEIHITLSDPPT